MATIATVPAGAGVERCRARDQLILAFLLSANRLNENRSRVEFARTPEFREEARLAFERSRRQCKRLQGVIALHCLNHKC